MGKSKDPLHAQKTREKWGTRKGTFLASSDMIFGKGTTSAVPRWTSTIGLQPLRKKPETDGTFQILLTNGS
jgi:hypothetical protein